MDKREQARRLYAEGKSLKDIAAELGVPYPTVKSWKQRGKIKKDAGMRTDASRAKDASRKREGRTNRAIVQAATASGELSPKEIEFCLHYVRTYNPETAMLRSGLSKTARSARSHAYEYMRKPAIKAEIKRLQAIKGAHLLAAVDDLIEMHMRIAFADMGDIATWGKKGVVLRDADTVDGQIIRELSEGPSGVKVKLRDAVASMAFLERFFLANPLDKHKIDYDNKRLELERQKQNELLDAVNNPVVIVDDIGGGDDHG